jgi:hypothetical protein
MVLFLLCAIQLVVEQPQATKPSDPQIVFEGLLDEQRKLQVVRCAIRPATRPVDSPTTNPSTPGVRPVYPEQIETYEVRLFERDRVEGTALWRYERNRYPNETSRRLRYRVLAATLIKR